MTYFPYMYYMCTCTITLLVLMYMWCRHAGTLVTCPVYMMIDIGPKIDFNLTKFLYCLPVPISMQPKSYWSFSWIFVCVQYSLHVYCMVEELSWVHMLKKVQYCKITYFCWDFISRFCHIVFLQQSKIRIGRVVIENSIFSYSRVLFDRDHTCHNILAKILKIKPTRK
jgi:hypothetical protein